MYNPNEPWVGQNTGQPQNAWNQPQPSQQTAPQTQHQPPVDAVPQYQQPVPSQQTEPFPMPAYQPQPVPPASVQEHVTAEVAPTPVEEVEQPKERKPKKEKVKSEKSGGKLKIVLMLSAITAFLAIAAWAFLQIVNNASG